MGAPFGAVERSLFGIATSGGVLPVLTLRLALALMQRVYGA